MQLRAIYLPRYSLSAMGRWSLAAYGNCWWSSSQGRYSGTLAALCNSTLRSQCQRCKTTAASYTNAHTHIYLQFLYEHCCGCGVYPEGKRLKRGPETGSMPPSDSLFFLRLLLEHLSPSMSFYLHSRLFSSNSLPDRCRGAALLLRRDPYKAEHTQKWMVRQ